jgi:hypothetical protein
MHHIFKKRAENEVTKPTDSNQGINMQPMSRAQGTFGSSNNMGMITTADAIKNDPMHSIDKKMGCNALTVLVSQ